MRPRTALAAGLLLAWACAAAHAASIDCNEKRLSLVIQPEQGHASAEFIFRNVSTHPISIGSIVPSCPCMAAAPPGRSFAPGESGKITVVFYAGDREGTEEKTIAVTTDEPGSAPAVLFLGVRILRYFSVEPHLLNLAMGGDSSELSIRCGAGSSHPIVLTGVNCSLPGITATVETLDPGRNYIVRLRSAPRQAHDTALITVTANVEGVGPRDFPVYAYFR
jgi:hypothetical protein